MASILPKRIYRRIIKSAVALVDSATVRWESDGDEGYVRREGDMLFINYTKGGNDFGYGGDLYQGITAVIRSDLPEWRKIYLIHDIVSTLT